MKLAVRRTDVDELNLRARAHMTASGRLTGPVLTVAVGPYAERSFATGDLATARRNDYCRGLINGQRGTVTAVDPDAGPRLRRRRRPSPPLRLVPRTTVSGTPVGVLVAPRRMWLAALCGSEVAALNDPFRRSGANEQCFAGGLDDEFGMRVIELDQPGPGLATTR